MEDETKKLKILSAVYIVCFLLSIAAVVFSILLITIPIVVYIVCLAVGLIGIWILHSIMCYYRDVASSKFFAFGFGAINLLSLGIWGLVASIKVLTNNDN